MSDSNDSSIADKAVSLNEYQRRAAETDQNREAGLAGLHFLLLGLFGEVGTLLSALKKKQRDKAGFLGYEEAIYEEFGDTLWYFSNIASRAKLKLNVIAQRMFRRLGDWGEIKGNSLNAFAELQSHRKIGGSATSDEFEKALIALAGKTGLFLNDFENGRVTSNGDVLSGHLTDVLGALVTAADAADVDLAKAAAENLSKINSRWPRKRVYAPLFDKGYNELEQLPRLIEMSIFERSLGTRTVVLQQRNGVNIGSAITDNKMTDDDYRFHDAFHLAYAAILGWSPVLRGLFKLKRKSVPKVDEAEDGARAILIEEGISTLIFQRALRFEYFEGIASLDYSLLKMIPEFVAGYEVEACPLWQWEQAILEGFKVFRMLREHRKGIVVADLNKRTITFRKLR